MAPEFIIFIVLIRVVIAVAAGAVASSKGRNVAGWFCLSLLFEIIPLIIVACLPNLKQQKADQDRIEMEQRRLREQLRQERIKNEAFRQYAAQRLDTHDQVLGIETRTAQALPGPEDPSAEQALSAMSGGGAEPLPVAPPPAQADKPRVSASASVWYYEMNGAQQGPVTAVEIKGLLDAARIRATTLVWTEGLADWVPLARIPWFGSQVAT
ncbi:MAG: DUF4339 domain-containing protein [Planctomycetota bacterium]|nr:DUF4339 domain-containing protein [Planctomycetota bacterium]